jgi:hypothetical protein
MKRSGLAYVQVYVEILLNFPGLDPSVSCVCIRLRQLSSAL